MRKIIILAFLVLLCGCTTYDPVDNSINNINKAKSISKQRTAELIAKEVEFAYTSYLFNYSDSFNNSCSFMDEYFNMNGVLSIKCINDETTIIMENGDSYKATYLDGKMIISGADEDIIVKIDR